MVSSSVELLLSNEKFQFLNFGANHGHNVEWVYKTLGESFRPGLTLDSDARRVAATQSAGHKAVSVEVGELPSDKLVEFVYLPHFLQRQRSLALAAASVRKAVELARNCVLIRQPSYESDSYLAEKGLKFFWSDWGGHPTKMAVEDFSRLLSGLVKEGAIRGFSLHLAGKVTSSDDATLHALESPGDMQRYDPLVHSGKPAGVELKGVYREVIALLAVEGDVADVRRCLPANHLICDSLSPDAPKAKEPAVQTVQACTSEALETMLSQSRHQFFDFGTSRGECMSWAYKVFKDSKPGLGFDVDARKVAVARQRGHEAVVFDILKIPEKKWVDFVCLSHFLEHIPSLELAVAFIHKAAVVAKKFVFIRQPFFDKDDELKSLGLKLYWSDWHGHPNRMTSGQVVAALDSLKSKGLIQEYSIYFQGEVASSDHNVVHPLASPRDQQKYDSAVHPPKAKGISLTGVFKEIYVLVVVRGDGNEHFGNLTLDHWAGGKELSSVRRKP